MALLARTKKNKNNMNIHFHNRAPMAKQSKLLVNCNRCGQPNVPYDPSNILGNSLCPQCEWAISEQSVPPTASTLSSTRQRDITNPSTAAMVLLGNPKREALASEEDKPPSKRRFTNSNASASTPLTRRSVMGPAAQSSRRSASPGEEDEDEDFVDAPEVLLGEEDARTDTLVDAGEVEENDDRSIAEDGEQDGEAGSDDVDEEEEEEDDLFTSTFGSKATKGAANDDNDDDSVNSIEIQCEDDDESPEKANTSLRTHDFSQPEHTKNCPSSRGPSTPSDSQKAISKPPPGPRPPHAEKDLSPNLTKLRSFHKRALQQIPRLPLAAHRYWIGVLNLGVNPNNTFTSEKQFTWMKGNRMTTVETVWHTYSMTTAQEEFVLLLGWERLWLKDRVEELDYFNTKKIFFRAVETGCAEAKGRRLCEGLIKWEKGGYRDTEGIEGEKEVVEGVREVIEIEDD